MPSSYDPSKIEQKWQDQWRKDGIYALDTTGADTPYYALVEFPYPSGNLHVGHWYAFAVPDIRARYLRMTGKDVLFPVGFDSFGLPAENAAIRHGKDPKAWTDANIAYMKGQLQRMGGMFDTERIIQTSAPEYYRWTQWMFARFFEAGLVYRAGTLVNWCPVDKTVLANEQVVDGRSERSGALVEKREMKQWMLRITKYADALVEDLETLDWPQEIKESQKNWIGRSKGAELWFEVHTDIKRHYVLLHGYDSSPDWNYHRWLEAELLKRGHTVEIPTLPNPGSPDVREQAKHVLDTCQLDADTVIVAHSLGTNVAMRVLEQLATPIAGTVLVGGFISDAFAVEKERDVTFDFTFDFEKITANAGAMTLLHGENEETISDAQWQELTDAFPGAHAIVQPGQKEHFRAQEESAVLRAAVPHIPVFTTRPDTLFGVTYMVIAPEHKLLRQWMPTLANQKEVAQYQKAVAAKTDLDRQQSKDKSGVELSGLKAVHPATGKKIPVWIADYVLAGYGTGAIMAVPAHDDRDREFAETHGLEVTEVIAEDGTLIHSADFTGLEVTEAKQRITEAVGGRMITTYKQRDWGISRQRYWGTPIPIVYDPDGKPHAVPDEHLPWLLPTDVDFTPDGTAPLARSAELRERTERIFGSGWTPETDTMDAFVDSTWYFMRYLDPANNEAFADPAILEKWLPVSTYSGGAEHTTMHVLYSRFWYKALADLGYVPGKEPYRVRMNRGLILGPDGKKMSKSKGNVVDPDAEVARFGADTLRAYLAFVGPYNETGQYPWNPDGLAGARRFIEKVWRIRDLVQAEDVEMLQYPLHYAITVVERSFQDFKMNTAVAQLMGLAGEIEKAGHIGRHQLETYLKLLAPIAPHVTEELWHLLGHTTSIHLEAWPNADAAHLKQDTLTLAVQINGKVRAEIQVGADASEQEITQAALEAPGAEAHLHEREIKKIIVVPGRLVSIVV
jgi:leucyl-tRNA synthetase